MPYYSELGIYTPSSSYTNTLVKGPYSNHSSILASNILPPSVKNFTRNNFRGYRPHLTTISESSAISPLNRISSPKLSYHSSPKIKVPRPIKINTADIDVSLNKYKKYDRVNKPKTELESRPPTTRSESKSPSPSISRVSSPKSESKSNEPSSVKEQVDATPNSNIRRNRRSIRLHTIYKDTVDNEIKDIKSWRDNFKPEELVTEAKVRKKTQGEILKEKFLIRSKSKENIAANSVSQKITRRPSIKTSSSFKDICKEISSDQSIEDLNPGQPIEIRRRQSRQVTDDLLNEIKRSSSTFSIEEVELLDALINAEADGLLPPEEFLSKHEKGRKKKVTRKRSSDKLTIDDISKKDFSKSSSSSEDISQKITGDSQPLKRRSSNKRIRKSSSDMSIPEYGTSRLRKDSSLTNMVKDISQVEVEMISTKPKPLITSSIGEIEEKVKSNLKAVIDDVEVEESPKPVPKKEKKFRFNVNVEELPVKKKIFAPKMQLDDQSRGVVQLPTSKLPIVTSILKRNVAKHIVEDLGEPKILKKKDVIIAKSLSEVSMKSTEKVSEKAQDDDNVTYTILTKLSKTKSNESVLDSEGHKKIKIMLVKQHADKIENNKAVVFENQDVTSQPKNFSENPVEKLDNKSKNQKSEESGSSKRSSSSKNQQISKSESETTRNKTKKPAPATETIVSKDETKSEEGVKKASKNAIEASKIVVDKNEDNGKNQIDENDGTMSIKEDIGSENQKAEQKCYLNRSSTSKEKEIFKIELETSSNETEGAITDNILNKDEEETKKEIKKCSKRAKKKAKSAVDRNEDVKEDHKNVVSVDKDENDNTINIWEQDITEYDIPKMGNIKMVEKTPREILKEIQEGHEKLLASEDVTKKKMMSKRSLIQKANKDDPDLEVFEPPEEPERYKEPTPEQEASWVPLQTNRLSQWMHPWKKPQQNAEQLDIYAKPKFIRARHIPRRWRKDEVCTSEEDSEESSSEDSSSEDTDAEEESEVEVEEREESIKVGASTSSNDSGFHSGRAKDKDCDVNCHKKCEKLTANLCGVNQKLVVEAIERVKDRKSSIDNRDSPGLNPAQNPAFALDSFDLPEEVSQSSTYQSFQKSGRITPPATTIPRFRKYCVDDFNFLKVLGKGSFGKVLLAELKGTEYYYAIKCLKKDVVLEDDDVECTLIERKVLALGTKHPYLCHLLCTFQTESHLFFVMEYLNGGDLMFHIQVERRFSEARARFYGAEIISGLRFLHNKGIVYRDLKLDNILLDFDGHVRIADFGMCKLQIFLDRMADTFCGTPDYMAPEIIKGQHYNQCADWWSFGVLLYEMLLGQSPFSGCDEDELFWSICNEKPVIPRFLSAEASSALLQFLDKDATKRLGNRFSVYGDIQDHPFFKPIDWVALEARQLEPPFKPNLQHPLDTQYFDRTFTTERAKLTPIENQILQSIDQMQFQGFSYTNPNATDK